MIIWAIISTVIAITLLIALAHYRSQIKKNCQQLEVMQSHTTNQRLTAEVPYKEINEMEETEQGTWVQEAECPCSELSEAIAER